MTAIRAQRRDFSLSYRQKTLTYFNLQRFYIPIAYLSHTHFPIIGQIFVFHNSLHLAVSEKGSIFASSKLRLT